MCRRSVSTIMKITDYIAQFLAQEKVPCVFEMSGGMITHLLDSIHQDGRTPIVSVHHEQTAAFAAEAVGRMTGIPTVAMATSGPGATNLLTGIGSAYFDSSPTVFITGQVNRFEQKGDRAIRQLGFQETDIVSMAQPITKAAWMAQTPEEVPHLLRRAFDLAVEGRPGPVLLDLPMDVQNSLLQESALQVPQLNGTSHHNGTDEHYGMVRNSSTANGSAANGATNGSATSGSAPSRSEDTATFLAELFAALGKAERPLIIFGGGIRSGRVTDLARRLSRALGVPAVLSLMAVDVLPFDDPLRVGWYGSYGNRWANLAIGESDLLLVLGSRLDVRQTGADVAGFKGERPIFHVDVEPGEMNNRVKGCRTLVSHLHPFLQAALQSVTRGKASVTSDGKANGTDNGKAESTSGEGDSGPYGAWRERIADLKATWPDTGELPDVPGINPNAFMHQLSGHIMARGVAAYVTDVGQHQMWAAQSLEIGEDQRFLTSGGMGSMGFGLPAAIGAALVSDGRAVVLVAGDGGFQSNLQELETVARNHLPVKMVIINNGCHGMVRQFQESYFDGRYQSTLWGYSAPDFARVSTAYGIDAHTVADPAEVEDAIEWLWRDPSKPQLLQVMVDTYANAYPKIAFGRPLTEMEPFAKPIAMEST